MFNFSSDPANDLAANRNGVLDPAQKNRLQARLLAALAPAALVGLVVGLMLFVLVPFVWVDAGEDLPWLMLIFVGLPLVGLVVWLFTGAVGRAWAYVLATVELLTGEPAVQFADGDLTWGGRGYRARGEGYHLTLPPNADWLPANYRFYILPRSRLIINAERIAGEVDTATEVNRALQSTIGFTPADLHANQHNQLGGRQRLALLGQAWPLVLVMVFFGGALVLPMALFTDEMTGEDSIIIIIMLGFFVIFFGVVVLLTLLPLVRDILAGQVVMWEGLTDRRAVTTGSGKSRSTTYYYEVNGQRAVVTRSAYDALVPNQRYRVHVAPLSKRVVGAEWLG